MPWAPGNVDKYKKGLSSNSKIKWSRIANALLAQGKNESSAIRIANSQVKPSANAVKRKLKKGI